MTKTIEIAKTHGGKRGKSGRKPLEDKKVPIQVYDYQSLIDRLGGLPEVKLRILNFLKEENKKEENKTV